MYAREYVAVLWRASSSVSPPILGVFSYVSPVLPSELLASLLLCSLSLTSFYRLFPISGSLPPPGVWSFFSSLFSLGVSFSPFLDFQALPSLPLHVWLQSHVPLCVGFLPGSRPCKLVAVRCLWRVWLPSRDLSALPSPQSTSWLRAQQPRSGWLTTVVRP